jgi:hypothetical protein
MSDRQLPKHLEALALATSWGGDTRDEAKIRTILAAAVAVVDMDGRVLIPDFQEMTHTDKCAFCGRYMGQICKPNCPHRQLKEALADD